MLARLFPILCFLLMLDVVHDDSICALFETRSASDTVTSDGDVTDTSVVFTLNTSCIEKKAQVNVVKVYQGNSPAFTAPVCRISFNNGKCSAHLNCACNRSSDMIFAEIKFDDQYNGAWLLVVGLQNGKTVEITPKRIDQRTEPTTSSAVSSNSTSTASGSQSSALVSTSSSKNPDETTQTTKQKQITTSDTNKDFPRTEFYTLLLSFMGCVLLVAGVFFAYISFTRKRRHGSIDQVTREFVSASIHSLVLNGLKQHELRQAAFSKEDYQGSNVSLTITNELYGEGPNDRLPVSASPSVVGLAAEKVFLPPRDSGVGSAVYGTEEQPHVGVPMKSDGRERLPLPQNSAATTCNEVGATGAFPRTRMDITKRERMPLPPEAFKDTDDDEAVDEAWGCSEEGEYTEIDDVLDNKNGPVDESKDDADLYTDIDDIKREKK